MIPRQARELHAPSPRAETKKMRNPGIDLIRGLAILLVVMSHIGLRIPLETSALSGAIPASFLRALTGNGYESVFMFFVISGFLIASNELGRWGDLDRIHIREFYVRRFARIAPCLLVLVAVLSLLHLLAVPDYVIDRAGQSLPQAICSALGLYLNWYEGQTGYLPGNWDVLWSLSVEEVFYLAFPLVCLLTRRRAVLVALLVVLAVSMPWTHASLRGNEIWQEKAYMPGMSAIAIGVLGALLASHWGPPRRLTVTLLGWLATIGLLAVAFDGTAVWKLFHDGYLLVLTLSTLCVLLTVYFHANAIAWWSSPWLAWLRSWGRLSYEIYLSHMFVVYGVVRVYRLSGHESNSAQWWYVLALTGCWLLGVAVERSLARPFARLLRKNLA